MYSVDSFKKGLDKIMLVWADPLEQYGANFTTLAPNSGYNIIKGLSISPGRTGLRGLQFNWNFGGRDGFLTRPLDNPTTTLGMGAAWNPPVGQMNRDDTLNAGFSWYSTGVVLELHAGARADGSIGIYDRTGALKGATPPNQLSVGNYIWIEVKAIGNTAGIGTGSAEVRVQGISKLIVNNINLPNAFAYHAMGGAGTGNQDFNFDDWIVWDGTGLQNNTFMGDRRLIYCAPSANAATQDFVASAGSAFNCVNQIPPVDTTYIEGAAAGNISEFVKAAIGVNSTDIAAVVICGRMFKTDAGVASARIGINSVGNVLNSAELFPGTTGQYFFFAIEKDPNGNIPWTRANVDAANVRVTRVT